MMDRVVSFRKTVCGAGSPASSHSDVSYEVLSNRFRGLLAAPRPRFSSGIKFIVLRGHRENRSYNPGTMTSPSTSAYLADIGRDFHRRGWTLGTSGNFSTVIEREPLRIAITASSVDKGHLGP